MKQLHRHLAIPLLTVPILAVILAVILALLVPLSPATVVGQVRIMPLGDSITQGGQGYASYRYPLWFDLEQGGHVVDFVGQRDFIHGGSPDPAWYPDYYTTFDRDHEGYWGWRTDEIAGIIHGATVAGQPDIVLIHLGTNDIGQMGAAGVTNADVYLRQIIGQIRSVTPAAVFLLAQVIPIGPGSSYYNHADQVAPLNAVIATIAADSNTIQSPNVLVDQNSGFDLDTMMQSDGLHPNLVGEAQMAGVWLAALIPLLTPAATPSTIPETGLGVSAYPNPFNPVTTVHYTIPRAGPVSLTVLDAAGRVVDRPLIRWFHESGTHELPYRSDGASGIYLVRVEMGGLARTTKIVRLK